MNKQEVLLTGRGKAMGDGRAEGLSAIGRGGEAAVSLEPYGWHRLWFLAGFNSTDALASRHSGLEIKMQHYCTLHSTVQQSTQKRDHVERICTHDNVHKTHALTRFWTCEHTSHLWKLTTNLKVLCRGLTIFLFSSLCLLFSLHL